MFLLVMVLDDSTKLNEILLAWRGAGVQGVTILESTGQFRVLPRHSPQPMYSRFGLLFGGGRVGHHTLFALIDDMDLAETAVLATEQILGDLSKPHTGLIFAIPVAKSWGVPEPYADEL